MSLQPKGEDLRKAVKWISEQKQENSDIDVIELATRASIQFDLPPNDSQFLIRFVKEENNL